VLDWNEPAIGFYRRLGAWPLDEWTRYRLDGADSPMPTGAFSYMQFPRVHDVPMNDIVSVEHLEGSYYMEEEEQTFRYRVAFEYLARKSLDPGQSLDLIKTTAEEMWPI